jgi:ribosomal protein S18 acetylase RimI-like enzyme
MITIQTLLSLTRTEIDGVVSGYSSSEKYVAAKQESEALTTLSLTLTSLEIPYHKHFEIDDAELANIQQALPYGHSLGAYDDERLVGLAVAEPRQWNNSLWVWEFDVSEAYQRQGIGTRLVATLANRARQEGFRCLVCETQNTNVPAIRFYRRAGFELDGVDLTYYTNADLDQEVAVFMKLKI